MSSSCYRKTHGHAARGKAGRSSGGALGLRLSVKQININLYMPRHSETKINLYMPGHSETKINLYMPGHSETRCRLVARTLPAADIVCKDRMCVRDISGCVCCCVLGHLCWHHHIGHPVIGNITVPRKCYNLSLETGNMQQDTDPPRRPQQLTDST